ncbi:hypothetical protein VTO42DRAFT_5318 [Malbranchea cinnamomea]
MPKYEDDDFDSRRYSSHLPDRRDRVSSRSDHRSYRSSRGDRPSSTSPRSSPERYRRDHGSRRYRSRSRDSRKRHRSRSRERPRRGRDYGDHTERSPRPRSRSPSSRSPPPRRRAGSVSPRAPIKSKKPLPSQRDVFSKTPLQTSETSTPAPEKTKPNFSNTGLLAAEANTVRAADGSASIVLKYHEPPEARKPPAKEAWRLYIFKGEDVLDTIELGGRSCWLIGKERLVADLPVDHPSCSKQHAAIQFRYVEKRNEFGDRIGRVRPYLIDLESSNGTTVNGDPAPPGRFMELKDKDVIKFGLSTREYVLILPPPEGSE